MRLTSLRLENFRQFQSLDVDLDPLTVFVGANNAGKSTILDAIGCLLSSRSPAGDEWTWNDAAMKPRLVMGASHPAWDEVSMAGTCLVIGTFAVEQHEAAAWEPLGIDSSVDVGVRFDVYTEARSWPSVILTESNPLTQTDWSRYFSPHRHAHHAVAARRTRVDRPLGCESRRQASSCNLVRRSHN